MARATVSYTAELKDLRKQLATIPNITRAEAVKMARELDRSVRAAERQSAASAKKVEGHWQQAHRGLQASAASLPGMGAALNLVTNPLVALPGMFAAAGLAAFRMASDLSASVDQANLMAAGTGLQVETLGALEYALAGAGVKIDAFQSGLTQFNRKVNEGAQAFGQLGIATRDSNGSLRQTDDVLRDTFDALSRIDDEGQRAAAAAELFGVRGAALAAVMSDLNADLARGSVIAAKWYGPEAQAQSAAYNKQIRDMKTEWRGVSQVIAIEATDALKGFQVGLDALIVGSVHFSNLLDAAVKEWWARVQDVAAAADALFDRNWKQFQTIAERAADRIEGRSYLTIVTEQAEAATFATLEAMRAQEALAGAAVRTGGAALTFDPNAPDGPSARRRADTSTAPAPPGADGRGDLQALTAAMDAQRRASADLLDARARVLVTWQKELARIDEVDARFMGLIDLSEARYEIEARMERELTAVAATEAAKRASAAEQETTARLAAHQRLVSTQLEVGEAYATGVAALASSLGTETFLAQRLSALASIAVDTWRTAMAWAPALGPAAVPAAVGLGAIAAANVMAVSPPSYHSGGMARDETPARLLREESVLTASGTARLGGEQAVNRLNRGEDPSPGYTLRVVQEYRHQSFEPFLADHLLLPGTSLRDRLRDRRNGYGRRDAR